MPSSKETFRILTLVFLFNLIAIILFNILWISTTGLQPSYTFYLGLLGTQTIMYFVMSFLDS